MTNIPKDDDEPITQQDAIEVLQSATAIEGHGRLTPAEALEKAKTAAREGTISFASDDKIKELDSEVGEVLLSIGIKRAMVTDLSTIGDFGRTADVLTAASEKLGVRVEKRDYVWEVADRLRKHRVGYSTTLS